MDSNGMWNEVEYTLDSGTSIIGNWKTYSVSGGYYFDNHIRCTIHEPVVNLKKAPSWSPIAGQDNVRITYVPFSMDIYEEHNVAHDYDVYKGFYNETLIKLLKSDVFYFYNSRLFIGDGNKAYYSEPSQPMMIPDNYWFEVENKIMSFATVNSNLSIITNGSSSNAIFIATESTETVNSTTGETETRYSIKPSNAGIGAINGKCNGTLNDEPLFLTKTGVYGILTNWLSDKYAVSRSERINRQLCKEPNLEQAVGIAYNGYFYIAINEHMYVLDSRHKESVRGNNTSYEGYYFDNMPIIKSMFVVNDIMMFSDGKTIYRWNDDLAEYNKYYDNAIKVSDGEWTGEPVKCKWCSTFDDDGAPQKLKTLNKKGTMVTIQPHARTSVELTLIKDGDEIQHLGIFEADMISFERIDLTKFSFKSNQITADIFPKKKIKKYKRLQFVLENTRAEPFGITNVVKTYTVGNYAKR